VGVFRIKWIAQEVSESGLRADVFSAERGVRFRIWEVHSSDG